MPMIHVRGASGPGDSSAEAPSTQFTGKVYMDRAHRDGSISMNTVIFTPCARTNWHKHESGQFLQIKAGSGWICDKGEKPQRLNAGDVVWCPPGTTHWHGADGKFV